MGQEERMERRIPAGIEPKIVFEIFEKISRIPRASGHEEEISDWLMAFADKLEKATIDTIESGKMTKDLALITTLENPTVLNSEDFIKAIAEKLKED